MGLAALAVTEALRSDPDEHIPAWEWIGENFTVLDADAGRHAPFIVFPWMARILIDLLPPGQLPYNLCLYSTIKKSGKTAINAAVAANLMFNHAPGGADLYTFANSKEQSVGRIFKAVKYAVDHNPRLKRACHNGRGVLETIIRRSNGTTLMAMAAMHANIAGASPYYSGWSELWGYEHEKELRAWAEMTPPPTIRNSIRFVDTYAGYEGESGLLNGLEDQARQGVQPYRLGFALPEEYREYAERVSLDQPALAPYMLPAGDAGHGPVSFPYRLPVYIDADARLYAYWDEGEDARRMPWQRGVWGAAYYASEAKAPGMTDTMYARLHLNKRAKRGGQFVSTATWDGLPRVAPWQEGDQDAIYLAVDAAVRDDHMSLVGCRLRDGRPEECYVANWLPSPDARDPTGKLSIDPQAAVDAVLALRARGMHIFGVAYDPYQFHSAALALAGWGVTIYEFTQGVPRLEADTHLHTLIRDGGLAHTGNETLRTAVEAANMLEEKGKTGENRQLRIIKGSGKVDPLVALSMAIWYAMREPVGPPAAGVAPPPPQSRTAPSGRRQLSPLHSARGNASRGRR